MGWLHGFLSNFTGGDNFDNKTGEEATLAQGIENLNNALNQSENEFNLKSAREAMQFEAEQAELNRLFQQSSAREAMQFEADQAKLNREFQLEMSNTAYQRAMADLKKSGLNPILAYAQGGASTTAGATASGQIASGSSASGIKATSGTKNAVDIASQLIVSVARLFSR